MTRRCLVLVCMAASSFACVAELGGPGEAPGEPLLEPDAERAISGGSGEGTSGEVACPSSSCVALASGTTNILSCQGNAMLVRCENGRPRCFACRAGHSCFFNNGGAGQDDRCSATSSGFAWPAIGVTITQSFGCGNCAWYAWNAAWGCCLHNGLDLAAPWGTPVRASAAGTVVSAAWSDYSGYFVQLDHGGGALSYYGHLAQQPYVSVGQWVAQGDTLGPMGSTGLSTGSHTHFMIKQGGVPVDPRPYLP